MPDLTWIIFDLTRLLPLMAVLVYAAKQDIQKGEVTNKIWLYTPIGFALMLTEYILFSPTLLLYAFLSIAICIGATFAIHTFTKHGWGGADTKALLTITLTYPLGPIYSMYLPLYPILTLWIALAIAFFYMLLRKQKQTRFIPFITIAFALISIL